jgi:hypothetical protein
MTTDRMLAARRRAGAAPQAGASPVIGLIATAGWSAAGTSRQATIRRPRVSAAAPETRNFIQPSSNCLIALAEFDFHDRVRAFIPLCCARVTRRHQSSWSAMPFIAIANDLQYGMAINGMFP